MRAPEELTALVDDGIIDDVLRPLMSGKEAQIYLVRSQGQQCVAKVYKDAKKRSFKHRADYTEGRKVRNSRDQRAMNSGSRHGREQDEASWRNTEVDTIYKLHYAGVRVPTPMHYVEGVLVMELVTDESGSPAPRLGDVRFSPAEASEIYHFLIQQVVRMACAGVVHGDLSDFNVLIGARGPVIIDFPQAVDPARNLNARKLLLRDVENLHRFVSRFSPGTRRLPYGEEIWNLLEKNALTPETRLTGRVKGSNQRVDTAAVLSLIGDANRDEQRRRERTAERVRQAPSQGRDGHTSRERIAMPVAIEGAPRPRRVEITIPSSHRNPRTPTGDWPRGQSGAQQRNGGGPAKARESGPLSPRGPGGLPNQRGNSNSQGRGHGPPDPRSGGIPNQRPGVDSNHRSNGPPHSRPNGAAQHFGPTGPRAGTGGGPAPRPNAGTGTRSSTAREQSGAVADFRVAAPRASQSADGERSKQSGNPHRRRPRRH